MDIQKLLLNALGMQPEEVIIEKYLTNADQLSTSTPTIKFFPMLIFQQNI